ncbi:MAG: elongation factor P maturation arginine rhamnosyltransferase EarP [Polaromonas sp.]|uniref:elongation factor P maturation arginine rhamnosyltransferase EarP n=1 Tax=Polaromonas sp. TaxID=1869339 RepID=UPI0017DD9D28|nr:elongation factor P maturation arginine rhamnosyltransferase EarP [Polaromonas sp.]NMM10347.1 elongation factor P maturation arginine rhamnosyltransferase EarP [Polaromonas sp.]
MNRSLQWDIFCKVVDNYGDIGVCWRLAADLASRGAQVRLWVDDASALQWMAPFGYPGVRVMRWAVPLDLADANLEQQPSNVMIEAFGCEIAPEFIAACAYSERAGILKPVWINLEYLSAESYVERCHAMPSPTQSGPAAGWIKWFFYPGFTALTGGLLREPGLTQRQASFDRVAWLLAQGIPWCGEKLISLFCYEPPALSGLLEQLAAHGLEGRPVRLLVTAGRTEHAVKAAINHIKGRQPSPDNGGLLSISYLAKLTQLEFDYLLWACDLNFVRGEDSLVRALWAGKPFVWQIYPQHDDAHLAKLQAFLDALDAPPSLRALYLEWNKGAVPHNAASGPMSDVAALQDLQAWRSCALAARSHLLEQDDLTTRLLQFVAKNR